MKRVGILGGTFDPPHSGHIELARTALTQYSLDRVMIMTGGNPPHKRDREITDSATRNEMVRIAFEGENRIEAFDYEIAKQEYSYTANTLTELKQIYPDWEIYFIIGEDSLRDLPEWYKPQTICQNCILLVYPRDNHLELDKLIAERKNQFSADIRPLYAQIIDVSSTEIRDRIRSGESAFGLVPDRVMEYINEKGLYR